MSKDTHYIHLYPSNIQAVWCDRCNTGSVATYDIVTVGEHGVSVVGHGVYCLRCDDMGDDDEEARRRGAS